MRKAREKRERAVRLLTFTGYKRNTYLQTSHEFALSDLHVSVQLKEAFPPIAPTLLKKKDAFLQKLGKLKPFTVTQRKTERIILFAISWSDPKQKKTLQVNRKDLNTPEILPVLQEELEVITLLDTTCRRLANLASGVENGPSKIRKFYRTVFLAPFRRQIEHIDTIVPRNCTKKERKAPSAT